MTIIPNQLPPQFASTQRWRLPAIAAAGLMAISLVNDAGADTQRRSEEAKDCLGPHTARRIEGCTRLLQKPLKPKEQSLAFAMRALAYSLMGRYAEALSDYDAALKINPDFASALNNRAWTYFKSGQSKRGLPDVERALDLSPNSAHAFDTRAHIRQSLGNPKGALKDYERAMNLGGPRLVKMYQCGLQSLGLFHGPLTGIKTPDLREAFETCVEDKTCDPLPADEDCRKLTS